MNKLNIAVQRIYSDSEFGKRSKEAADSKKVNIKHG